jgi:hypothetical protein
MAAINYVSALHELPDTVALATKASLASMTHVFTFSATFC